MLNTVVLEEGCELLSKTIPSCGVTYMNRQNSLSGEFATRSHHGMWKLMLTNNPEYSYKLVAWVDNTSGNFHTSIQPHVLKTGNDLIMVFLSGWLNLKPHAHSSLTVPPPPINFVELVDWEAVIELGLGKYMETTDSPYNNTDD
jgi:hypothetical protein